MIIVFRIFLWRIRQYHNASERKHENISVKSKKLGESSKDDFAELFPYLYIENGNF